MATQIETVRDRIASICGGLGFVEAVSPFDFTLQPTTQIDQVFRLESASTFVIGGFNYTEEREDMVQVWIARKQGGAPNTAYKALLTDVSSLRAGVVRDGATGGGDYTVSSGGGFGLDHMPGQEYAVLRLSLPVNYEAVL